MVILLAQSERDGMAKDVLILPALQTHGSTELSVFVQIQRIDVCHGNFSMVKNACTSRTHAPKEPDGMENHARQFQETVPTVSTLKVLNANHSHKGAFLQQFGTEADAFLMELAHMELSPKIRAANHILHAKMAKVGIQVYSNVSVQKEQDGTERNVSYVLEAKFGTPLTDAPALKDISWPDLDARNPRLICAD